MNETEHGAAGAPPLPAGATLFEAIRAWCAGGMSADDESLRDRVAVGLYQHQRERCAPLGRVWDDPSPPRGWRGVNPVPTTLFKDADLFCRPPLPRPQQGPDGPGAQHPTLEFRSSGTTRGNASRQLLADDALYRAALLPPFLHFCLPDGPFAGRFHVAAPRSYETHSSLDYMWSVLADEVPGTWLFHHTGEAPDLDSLEAGLRKDAEAGTPSFVLGTALALERLCRTLADRPPLRPAAGSRVFETGGFKGRQRDEALAELHGLITARLGLPPWAVITEYGMTELSSQAYSGALRAHLLGEPPPVPGRLFCPPWLRARSVDGLLAFFDAANADSCAFLLTGDEGAIFQDGAAFTLIGRAPGAGLRGCSLRTEQLLSSTPDHGADAPDSSASPPPSSRPRAEAIPLPVELFEELRDAAAGFSKLPADERCDRVAAAFDELVDAAADLADLLSSQPEAREAAANYLRETAETVTASGLGRALVEAERRGVAPRLTAQLAAGTVFTAALHPLALCLAAGAAQIWKPSSDEPTGFAEAVAARLNSALGFPLVRVVRWPGGAEPLESDLFRAVDGVIVQGDDGTIASVRDRLPDALPRLLYGHRYSVALLHMQDAPDGPEALGLARDALAYDGLGCLSPRLALINLPRSELDAWCAAFAAGPWAQVLRERPPLTSPLPGELFELRAFAARAAALDTLHGPAEAPIACITRDIPYRAPPGRCLAVAHGPPLSAVDPLEQVLPRESARIQGLALSRRARRDYGLGGPQSRLPLIAEPGRLQRPPVDWRHDGDHPLAPLFRDPPYRAASRP